MARTKGATFAIIAAMLLAASDGRPASAAEEDGGFKVPRFVSLHADKVNLRAGPGRQYPIEWVLTRKDMPVEVIAQFEHWRRIRGWDGTEGWVQQHMVGGKRYVLINKGATRPLYDRPDPAGALVARAEPGVVARLLECRGPWCRVEADGLKGWAMRVDLWGVYADEQLP